MKSFQYKLKKEKTTVSRTKVKEYKEYIESFPEGTVFEVTVTPLTYTNDQLRKIHSMIEILAEECGYTFGEFKKILKTQSGLIVINEKGLEELKSFSSCSKEELTTVIQTCYIIGSDLGVSLP